MLAVVFAPQDIHSPYRKGSDARLILQSSIDVDGEITDLLTSYFGSSDYDVKDINVAQDGTAMVFAAHGPSSSATDHSWNIYTYSFADQELKRVIAEDALANLGHDTSPTFTESGDIVFSSDRYAGNPDSELERFVAESDLCYLAGLAEQPSLLHKMSADGEGIIQLTFGNNHDTTTTTLVGGRVAFVRSAQTYESMPSCDVENDLISGEYFSEDYPAGLTRTEAWDEPEICAYTIESPLGRVLPVNNVTLLSIDPETGDLDQLYATVELVTDDSAFVAIDKLVQAESGHIVGLLKHGFQ